MGISFRLFFTTVLLLMTIGWNVAPLHAATTTQFFFESSLNNSAQVQQIFDVDVLIEAPEEINAIQALVVFSQKDLTVLDIRDGNSLIPFWIERPHSTPEGVLFSGVIPGGYQEKRGRLFTIRFRAEKNAVSSINLKDGVVLKHDGSGSNASFTVRPLTVTIVPASGSIPEPPSLIDTVPPEDFKPEITQDPNIFDGKWFVVFATQDKGVGIDHFEIKEDAIDPNIWTKGESPYLLLDQKASQQVSIKAIDKNGNERIVNITSPLSVVAKKTVYLSWTLFGILSLVILFFCIRTFRKKK